jgi:TRAP-type C4-dicarboxylate transport system permease small subunit
MNDTVIKRKAQKGCGSWLCRVGRGFKDLVGRSGTVFANITSLGIIIMILIGTIDVIGSELFNEPLPTTYEATEALMVVVTFGGLAFVQRKKMNINVDLLVRHFPPQLQIVSELFSNLIGLLFFGAFTWYGASFFWESFEIKEYAEALIPFPIYPTKFVMLVGVGLVTLQLLVDTFQTVKRLMGGEIKSS